MTVGSGLTEGVTIGPLIDAKAVDSTDEMVADAVDHGASLTTGGRRIEGPGYFYARPCSATCNRVAGCCARRSSARCWG